MNIIYVIVLIDGCSGDQVALEEGYFMDKQKAEKRCSEKNKEYLQNTPDWDSFWNDFIGSWDGPDGSFYVDEIKQHGK